MIKDSKRKDAGKPREKAAAPDVPPGETSNGRERARASRRSEANRQVLEELTALRMNIDQMLERYAIRVGGQIAELMQLIQGDGAVVEKPKGLTVKAANAMLEAIRETELKPKKGRGKDFVRVQRLVAKLRDLNPLEH